jgi:hypothetical protein
MSWEANIRNSMCVAKEQSRVVLCLTDWQKSLSTWPELHWENWDLKAEDPPYFPDSGEPEDYILGQPDSPSASAALGELWEVIVPDTARILHPKPVADSYKDLLLDLNTCNGADLFKSDGYATILFSEHGRAWFSEHWGAYVKFQEYLTT